MLKIGYHLRNLCINWGGHIASMLVMFFVSPYIVGKLDAVTYGIWSLLTVLFGYMGIFDIGVRSSVGRHIAFFLGKNDEKSVDETIRAGFACFSFTGGIVLIVGILLGWFFPLFFKNVPVTHYSTVRLLLPFMAINFWLSAISAIYSNILTAHDRFDAARIIDLSILFIRTSLTIYTLYLGWGLWGLAGSIAVGNFFALIFNRLWAGRVFQKLRSFPLLFSRERMKELFNYGFFAFISNVSIKIIGQSDLVIVGALLSVSTVREYSVGAMLIYYSSAFFSMIGTTFFPTIQKKVSSGKMDEAKSLFFSQVRISLILGLLTYIGIAFYSFPFIKLWMFQEGFDLHSVSMASTVMTILSLSKIPTLYILPCVSVLNAMGYVRFTATRSIIEAFVNVFLSIIFILVFKMGISGVAAGTLFARLLISSVSVPYYLCKKLKISAHEFITASIAPALLSSISFSIFCFILINTLPISNWFDFFKDISGTVFIWFFITFLFLLPVNIRKKLFFILKHKFYFKKTY